MYVVPSRVMYEVVGAYLPACSVLRTYDNVRVKLVYGGGRLREGGQGARHGRKRRRFAYPLPPPSGKFRRAKKIRVTRDSTTR